MASDLHNDYPRDESRAARKSANQNYAWIGGVVLILLGVVFLLQNFGFAALVGNWWALFILIPALGSAVTAWNSYRAAGNRLVPAARGALTGALILTTVAVILYFNLNWGALWPVFLIIIGLVALLGWNSREHED